MSASTDYSIPSFPASGCNGNPEKPVKIVLARVQAVRARSDAGEPPALHMLANRLPTEFRKAIEL
jgi:hypothetical protein